jgi:hypothetical protein
MALSDRDPERARPRRDARCLLWMHHYVRRYSSEGDDTGSHAYLECTRCGRFLDVRRNPWSTFF